MRANFNAADAREVLRERYRPRRCGYCLSARRRRLQVCFSTVPTRGSIVRFEGYSSPRFLLFEVKIFYYRFKRLVAIWWTYAEGQ